MAELQDVGNESVNTLLNSVGRCIPFRSQTHRGIEIDQRDRLDRGVGEDLTQREAVAAAEDQHAFGRPVRSHHRRVHERLVVAVLVSGRELQVAVEEQLEA